MFEQSNTRKAAPSNVNQSVLCSYSGTRSVGMRGNGLRNMCVGLPDESRFESRCGRGRGVLTIEGCGLRMRNPICMGRNDLVLVASGQNDSLNGSPTG